MDSITISTNTQKRENEKFNPYFNVNKQVMDKVFLDFRENSSGDRENKVYYAVICSYLILCRTVGANLITLWGSKAIQDRTTAGRTSVSNAISYLKKLEFDDIKPVIHDPKRKFFRIHLGELPTRLPTSVIENKDSWFQASKDQLERHHHEATVIIMAYLLMRLDDEGFQPDDIRPLDYPCDDFYRFLSHLAGEFKRIFPSLDMEDMQSAVKWLTENGHIRQAVFYEDKNGELTPVYFHSDDLMQWDEGIYEHLNKKQYLNLEGDISLTRHSGRLVVYPFPNQIAVTDDLINEFLGTAQREIPKIFP